jgi:hypothetical protein
MRRCPFPGCDRTIPVTLFACAQHWFSLGQAQRDEINAAYRRYGQGDIGIEDLRAIQVRVVAVATNGNRDVREI